MRFTKIISAVMLAALSINSITNATVITFDEIPGPTGFSEGSPLSEEYAHLGVHFQAPGGYDRGVVLNDSSWNIEAYSGRNFMAFNSYYFGDNHIETILFDTPVVSVSLFAAGYNQADTFRMTAYDNNNNQVDTETLVTLLWDSFGVSYNGGITKVTVEQLGPDCIFVYDDLSFEVIPEPATLSLLALGSLAMLRRRK